jgi:hypothetical protein
MVTALMKMKEIKEEFTEPDYGQKEEEELEENIGEKPSVKADNINRGVFSKDSTPYGTPYNEWISKWWNWTFYMPKGEHPRDDFRWYSRI